MTEPKWWDFTCPQTNPRTNEPVTLEILQDILAPISDRYCIGNETGETGYKHWQGRTVLKIGKELKALSNILPIACWTPTHVRNFDYVQKEGNYYCSWEGALARFACLELQGWQQSVLDVLEEQTERQVLVIYDPWGNHGKTWLAKHMVATHKAVYVPPLNDAQDFMAMALAKKSKGYIFDLPRADTRKSAKAMWSAIEQIKNGYLYDKRYQWQEAWIDPPKIVVFTNWIPQLKWLSRDRWQFYAIVDGISTIQEMPMQTVEDLQETFDKD